MIIDFATTAISGVKIENARASSRQLPEGCIVDKDGNPTTDPNAFFEGGAHVPFGGHKGYALMLAVEFLGRIFTASDQFARVPFGGPVFGHQGMTTIVFRADLFQPFADYAKRADEIEQRVRAVPPAPHFERVIVPGDLEEEAYVERLKNGIPIEDDMWQKMLQLAEKLGVAVQPE